MPTTALAALTSVVATAVVVTAGVTAAPSPPARPGAGAPAAHVSPAPSTPDAGAPPVRVGRTAAATAVTAWRWPLDPVPTVARPFAVGPHRWSPGHRGVDLRTTPGAEVRAPASGTVALARVVAGRPVLVLAHPHGLRTTYEPVAAALPTGTQAAAGAVIGRLAPIPGHCAPGGCLHWGALRGRDYLDPLTLLGLDRPIVLLPYLDDG